MQIEIVTAKKKLTKSLINQMLAPTFDALQHGIVLGYLINCKKDEHKIFLIEYESKYYIQTIGWELGDCGIYKKIGRWSRKKHTGLIDNKTWFATYEKIFEQTNSKRQIFI